MLESLRLLSPELILLITGFVVFGVDLIMRRRDGGRTAATLALVGLVLALVAAFWLLLDNVGTVVANTMVIDSYALFFKILAMIGAGLVIMASIDFMKKQSRYLGEYYALLVLATLAVSITVSATNLLLVYLGIEFLSITSYILAGFIRNDQRSEEAAIKYFLYGAVASAVMLYGISLLYGATGTLDLAGIAGAMNASGDERLLGIAAIILLLAGFGFKASLVPFHQWAPDTYDGAPTPVTAFLATVSKATGFAVLARVFLTALPSFGHDWAAILAGIAMVTMSLGNLVALKQTSVKRMLAYSSIAQAGYILLGLTAVAAGARAFTGLNGVLLYLLAYLFTNAGAFFVVLAVEQQTGSHDLKAYADLIRRSPSLALIMTIFLLSLAGVPATAGFMGKFFVFAAVVQQQLLFVAAVAVINTIIAAFYYLNVIRYMFFVEAKSPQAVAISPTLNLVLVGSAAMVLVIGIFAQPFIQWTTQSLMVIASGL